MQPLTTTESIPPSPTIRHRLTSMLACIAMLVAVLATAPSSAAAQEPPPPGSLTFVNSFTTARFTAVVDPNAASRQEIDMKSARTFSPIELAQGTHRIDIFAGETTSGTPFTTRSITVDPGASQSFVVHPTASGNVATSIFTNDESLTGSSSTRLVVRHTAAAGPVDVELRAAPSVPSTVEATNDSFTLANGQQGVISGAIANEDVLYELVISAAGSTTPLIIDNEVALEPGVVNVVYISGNPPIAEISQDPESLLMAEMQVGALPPPSVNLVNGFNTEQYVFYVDGTQNASIEGLRRNGGLQGLSEGTVTVSAYPNSGTPGSGTPSASLDIKVCDGRSYDLAIHAAPSGAATLTLFENDVTPTAAMSTRFTVRHISQFGPLDVAFMPSNENPSAPGITRNFQLTNTGEEVIDDAPINDYIIDATNPGTPAGSIARNGDAEGEGGATQIAYIMGSPPQAVAPPISKLLPVYAEGVIPGASAPGTGCTGGETTTGGGNTDPNPNSVGSAFTAIDPERILDTREQDLGRFGKIPAGESITVPVAGRGSVPAAGVTAVAINLTVTNPEGRGFVSARPTAPSGIPKTSSVNFDAANQNRAAMVTVPVAEDGTFAIFARTTTDVVVDVLGYYSDTETKVSAGRFVPLAPTRLFDSRESGNPSGKLTPNVSITIEAAGVNNVPSSGVDAIVMNLTAVEPEDRGFLRVTTTDAASGKTSSVNFAKNDRAVANQVVVPLDENGDFSLSARVSVHALGDVVGYFTDDTVAVSDTGLFVPVTPIRIADSRENFSVTGKVSMENPLNLDVVTPLGKTASDVSAVALTTTGTQAVARGWIRVSPEPTTREVSTLNLKPGDIRANSVYSGVGTNGRVVIDALRPVDVIVDISGYFTS